MPKLRTFSDLKNKALCLSNKSKSLFKEAEDSKCSHDSKNSTGRELLNTALEKQENADRRFEERRRRGVFDAQADPTIKLWNEILTGAEENFQL